MIKKIKSTLKKLLLSNNLTRYLFGIIRTFRNRELLKVSYNEYLNEDFQKVKLDNGNTMCLYKSDKKSHMYFDNTAYNDVLNSVWNDALVDVNLVYDLGANYGQFILHPISKEQAKKIEHIVAFEPNPKIARALNQSLIDSGLEGQVSLVQKGVSNKVGKFNFYINLYSSGGSSINPDNAFNPGDGIFRKKIEIETITLIDYTSEQEIDVKNKKMAMKIDIEGHDFFAFEGAIQIIKKTSDFLLIMETTKSTAKDFFKKHTEDEVLSVFESHSFYVSYRNTIFQVKDYEDYLTHFEIAPGCIDIILSSQPLNSKYYQQ